MGRLLFSHFWPLLRGLVYLFKLLPNFVHNFLWGVFSSFSGALAGLFRYLSFSARTKGFSKNSYIGTHVALKNIQNLQVGDNFSLHDFCYVDAIGGIEIGKNVSIAHGCSLISFNHTWEDDSQPIKYNPTSNAKIIIKDDVWLGCGVRVMLGNLFKE